MRPTYTTLLFLAAACSDRPAPKPPVADTTTVEKPDTTKHGEHDRDKHKKHGGDHEGHEGDDR